MPEEENPTALIEYAGDKIPVLIIFRDRKRLSITVHPDCSVTAVAPADRTVGQVVERLQKRVSWIVRQRRHFEQFHPLPENRRYLSGETHLYLGRQYRQNVQECGKPGVKLIGGRLQVCVPMPGTPSVVQAALETWYRVRAESVFQERLQRCLASTGVFRPLTVSLRIRTMKRRWGSCSRAGTITLNLDLIKAPVHCIEYVIMHELCHLIVHDHSPAFFRLLGRCMPDWRHRKERLDRMVLGG